VGPKITPSIAKNELEKKEGKEGKCQGKREQPQNLSTIHSTRITTTDGVTTAQQQKSREGWPREKTQGSKQTRTHYCLANGLESTRPN